VTVGELYTEVFYDIQSLPCFPPFFGMTVHFVDAGHLYSCIGGIYSNLPFLLSVAPSQSVQTQKKAQVGETAQDFTQNDVSRLCELAVVKLCVHLCV